MLRTPDTDASGDEDLSVGLHTRISPQADDMIKERARRAGLKAATWVRLQIYEALGLLKKRGRK